MTYRVGLVYDPEKVGIRFLQDVYKRFNLPIPSEADLRKPLPEGVVGHREWVQTFFHTHDEGKVLELVSRVINLSDIGIFVD